jgi:hypothetical protein
MSLEYVGSGSAAMERVGLVTVSEEQVNSSREMVGLCEALVNDPESYEYHLKPNALIVGYRVKSVKEQGVLLDVLRYDQIFNKRGKHYNYRLGIVSPDVEYHYYFRACDFGLVDIAGDDFAQTILGYFREQYPSASCVDLQNVN